MMPFLLFFLVSSFAHMERSTVSLRALHFVPVAAGLLEAGREPGFIGGPRAGQKICGPGLGETPALE